MSSIQFSFHDVEVRSAESGLGGGVNKIYTAQPPCARSVRCAKNIRMCESTLSSRCSQSSGSESYLHMACVMRKVRGGCHGDTGVPIWWQRGWALALRDDEILELSLRG